MLYILFWFCHLESEQGYWLNKDMKKWLYRWLPIIFGCHCREDRTFYFKGQKFPICARCTGELVGMIVSLFSCFFFRLSVGMSFFVLLPLIIDGLLQLCTRYESNNCRRFITGFLFGYGLIMLIAISTVVAFEQGVQIGKNLRK